MLVGTISLVTRLQHRAPVKALGYLTSAERLGAQPPRPQRMSLAWLNASVAVVGWSALFGVFKGRGMALAFLQTQVRFTQYPGRRCWCMTATMKNWSGSIE